MSCRETDGNSAVTSLAKFLTRSKEGAVSHLFHVIKKEAMVAMGPEGRELAPVEDVLTYLDHLRHTASHDVRVTPKNRMSLLRREAQARKDIMAGVTNKMPNKATFYAWQHLEERLAGDPSAKATVRQGRAVVLDFDDTAGTTPDGLVVTSTDVAKAKEQYERLVLALNSGTVLDRKVYSNADRQAQKRLALEVGAARDQFERMQGAYDSTDTGYAALTVAAANTKTGMGERVQYRERLKAAEARRSSEPVMVQYRKAAENMDPDEARAARARAEDVMREMEKAYRSAPTDRYRKAYENAVAEYRVAQRTYLYTLMSRPDVSAAVDGGDLRSSQTWASFENEPDVTRVDLWRAVDLYAADMDAAEVRIGRITEMDSIRRGLQRAESRQAVLDSEPGGHLDPINRRFAESLRRKRGSKAP